MKKNGIDQIIEMVMQSVRRDYAHNMEELEKTVSQQWDRILDLETEVKDLKYEVQAILSEIHGTGRPNEKGNPRSVD